MKHMSFHSATRIRAWSATGNSKVAKILLLKTGYNKAIKKQQKKGRVSTTCADAQVKDTYFHIHIPSRRNRFVL